MFQPRYYLSLSELLIFDIMAYKAYKGMVRPILEYGSSVWDTHPDKLQEELEKVQNRVKVCDQKLFL